MKDGSKATHIIINVTTTKNSDCDFMVDIFYTIFISRLLMSFELFFQFCNNFSFSMDYNLSIVRHPTDLK